MKRPRRRPTSHTAAACPGVAFVLPHFEVGGIETGVLEYANALANRGYAPSLILSCRRGGLLSRLVDGVTVYDLGGRRALVTIPALAKAIRLSRAEVVYSGTNARNIATLLAVSLIPARVRPAVLISEHTSPGDYLSGARAPRLRRALMRRLYPRAQALLAPTEGLAEDWLSALDLDRPRVMLQPNPILGPAALTMSERVATRTGPYRDPALIVAVGRFDPVKGHDLLIDAFARLHRQYPWLRLVIYGDGAGRAALETQIASAGLAQTVRLAGHTDDVAGALARAAVLAVPSRREGFGNVVIEALAQGTPVVATDCYGPASLLRRVGAAGRIVACNDPAALAEGLAAILGDPAARPVALSRGLSLARGYTVDAAVTQFVATARWAADQARGRPHR
ncbi:glycosyltransferase [Mesobaculum littorinae]|uniref:glycosyltransferase n=1 Tax=Mesobaculum littorinae TaxID=2486419 RepID=UPI0013E3F6BC|nr:glycosyltransferase [Mesobaculum littorinae]